MFLDRSVCCSVSACAASSTRYIPAQCQHTQTLAAQLLLCLHPVTLLEGHVALSACDGVQPVVCQLRAAQGEQPVWCTLDINHTAAGCAVGAWGAVLMNSSHELQVIQRQGQAT